MNHVNAALNDNLGLISNVLLKMLANHHEYDDGSEFGASSLHRQTSMMNHSCMPNVATERLWNTLVSGAQSNKDGAIVVRALCDLQAGDELCFNYGPHDLVTWPVSQRRSHLLDACGFWC